MPNTDGFANPVWLVCIVLAVAVLLLGGALLLILWKREGGLKEEARQLVDSLSDVSSEYGRMVGLMRGEIELLRAEVDRLRKAAGALDTAADTMTMTRGSAWPVGAGAGTPAYARNPAGPPPPSPQPADDAGRTDLNRTVTSWTRTGNSGAAPQATQSPTDLSSVTVTGRTPTGPSAPPPPAPAAGVPADDADQTFMPGSMGAQSWAVADASTGGEGEAQSDATLLQDRTFTPEQAATPFLEVVTGAEPGRRYSVPFESCSLGRGTQNGIVLDESKASRRHAEVYYADRQFWVKDLQSMNGTVKNGQSISEEPLNFGDRIRIGGTELRFSCDGFDLKDKNPAEAINAYYALLKVQEDYMGALHDVHFLLERDVARRDEANMVWEHMQALEKAEK